MKDYNTYTLKNFLEDDGFRDWVQRKGGPEEPFWRSFLLRYPGKKAALRQAERIILAAGHRDPAIDSREIRVEAEALLEQISVHEPGRAVETQEKQEGAHTRGWLPWIMAACIAAFLMTNHFLADKPAPPREASAARSLTSNLVKTRNDTDKPLRILLSDNSEVFLSPSSTLSYPSHFTDSSRTVHLTGEADFSVRKGSTPFMVYAGGVITKVLGTRFVVRAFEKDQNTTIRVRTGTVSVFEKGKSGPLKKAKENSGLIITANQAAVFEKSVRQFTKTLVSDPVRLSKAIDFESKRYDETQLSKILSDLEKAYGISILFDREQFEKCRITATLADENLYQKLEMLCKSIGAVYEIVDGQILILGKGC
ncbi:MAG: hypothetical protein ABS46_10155 [Cytophagaceae bacterium SCN 52-12]|nr:MAG: hypothetical protein ABS46_10155 [Cytophagaceae bacterium SCN 52-12]